MGRDKDALATYRRALDAGLANASISLLLLARNGWENEFKIWTGSPGRLFGWRRHGELYEAFRNRDRTYPELIADIRRFNQKAKQMTEVELALILVPLGDEVRMASSQIVWDASLSHYRRSEPFKTQIMKSGVYDYWRKHGFPPQCKPVGKDDFECN